MPKGDKQPRLAKQDQLIDVLHQVELVASRLGSVAASRRPKGSKAGKPDVRIVSLSVGERGATHGRPVNLEGPTGGLELKAKPFRKGFLLGVVRKRNKDGTLHGYERIVMVEDGSCLVLSEGSKKRDILAPFKVAKLELGDGRPNIGQHAEHALVKQFLKNPGPEYSDMAYHTGLLNTAKLESGEQLPPAVQGGIVRPDMISEGVHAFLRGDHIPVFLAEGGRVVPILQPKDAGASVPVNHMVK